MPTFVLGMEVGRLLCEAFGLPSEQIRSITLRNDISDVAWIEVVRYVTNDEAKVIAQLLQRYVLVLKTETRQELPMPADTVVVDVTDLGAGPNGMRRWQAKEDHDAER